MDELCATCHSVTVLAFPQHIGPQPKQLPGFGFPGRDRHTARMYLDLPVSTEKDIWQQRALPLLRVRHQEIEKAAG